MHGMDIRKFEEVTSTNELAFEAGKTGLQSATVFVADRQTAGRGRRGRTWESSKTQNLYFSLLCCPEVPADVAHRTTIIMATALTETIRELTGREDAYIKWPNDVVMNGCKVAGILTEMGFREDKGYFVVIGVGVNLGKQEFSEEIRLTATDIESASGVRLDKEILLEKTLERFMEKCKIFEKTRELSFLLPTYNGMLVNRGNHVKVLDAKGEYEGRAEGINAGGELLVTMENGEVKCVYAGEVSVRGLYGYV